MTPNADRGRKLADGGGRGEVRGEAQRLRTLREYRIMDTAPEPAFDRVTKLVADLFDVPIVLVSLVDADRQWFKSAVGLDAGETPRDVSFCHHAVIDDAPLVVTDARADPRFRDNPLVTGAVSYTHLTLPTILLV